jgi:shikimate dehydrogenase
MYLIFGKPVNHSKSPLMHNAFFKKYGINECYTRYELDDGKKIIEKFKNLKIKGANVTVPYKEDAFKYADEVRGVAKKIGAVNTLVLENDKVIGYNTDAPGFLESIKDFEYKNVLIFGAGGTAKAIRAILPQAVIVNRSKERIKNLTNAFTWDELDKFEFDLIINTTSAGLYNELPAPKELLAKLFINAKYAVDVVYQDTPFLKLAKEYNLKTRDGSYMLVYQGVLAMEIFLNKKLDKEEVAKLYFSVIN